MLQDLMKTGVFNIMVSVCKSLQLYGVRTSCSGRRPQTPALKWFDGRPDVVLCKLVGAFMVRPTGPASQIDSHCFYFNGYRQ